MMMHEFTFILDTPPERMLELQDVLFEAGCDDALLGRSNGRVYLDFDRESDKSLAETMLQALAAVEAGSDARVVRVEPDELVTLPEIAARTGRSRESIRLLASGKRGDGSFPTAVRGQRSSGPRLWRWTEVVSWLSAHEAQGTALLEVGAHLVGELEQARVIAAINGGLAMRDLVGSSEVFAPLRALP